MRQWVQSQRRHGDRCRNPKQTPLIREYLPVAGRGGEAVTGINGRRAAEKTTGAYPSRC